MFNKHSHIVTKTGSLNILIVDVSYEKIAFIDFNRSRVERKSRSKSGVKPKYKRNQSKPESMNIGDFVEMIENYKYLVSSAEYKNGLYVPQARSHLDQQRISRERKQTAHNSYV